MNIIQMYEFCKLFLSQAQQDYYYVGLRFEDKERRIGDICEYSRHNPCRDDEREFPIYATPEYEEMEVLDGTSAWNMQLDSTYKIRPWDSTDIDCSKLFLTNHCYIIANDNVGRNDDPDHGEILIKDAKVIAVIF
ncbi:hypothetical protein EBB07_29385 [Paenibacillaceae bacterium]|nr:hypothetical protein EBB07_29385 [Paenibacillaceae bacterium]